LNGDFRYQLTVIGQFAQAIVASEILDSKFSIKTDKPNVKVSWLVTGARQDACAKAHPLVVEHRQAGERGCYLHPELFGQPESRGIKYARQDPAPIKEVEEVGTGQSN
jgi:trimeric autotransporter adhesin